MEATKETGNDLAGAQSRFTAGLADDVLYSHKYDAYYNAKTGDWLEKVCGDKDCDYCPGRPEKAFVSANVEVSRPLK